MSSAAEFSSSLGADGKTVTISGKLDYQACDTQDLLSADVGAGAMAAAGAAPRPPARARSHPAQRARRHPQGPDRGSVRH